MNTGILVTVRTGSTRLPGKAMKNVCSKPVIEYLVNRIKFAAGDANKVIICTTTHEEDMVLRKISEATGVEFFQGEPENIIKRHYQCARHFGLDFIVNVDGDDILCSPEYVRGIIDFIKKSVNFDVVRTTHLPFGMNSMGYKTEVLKRILRDTLGEIDTGWGRLITDENEFSIYTFPSVKGEMLEARLSLDYQEDFLLFKEIIENLLINDPYLSTVQIIDYLKKNPVLVKSNIHLNEIYWENFNKKQVQKG